MTKLQLEYLRLVLTVIVFVLIITPLFLHINQVTINWFNSLSQVMAIPLLILCIGIPLWMIVDLIRKNVADKSIFNLTFFISVISIALLFFSIKILN